MSPYLTESGKWILVCGVLYLMAGVVLSSPVLLMMGEVSIVLIGIAMFLSVPGATAVDRRFVRIELEDEQQSGGHLVGEEIAINVKIQNRSGVPLHRFVAQPFLSLALEPLSPATCLLVPQGGSASGTTRVRCSRPGRWTLHGFDINLRDPLGLVETRDYLPATRSFEFYPRAGRMRSRRRRSRLGRHTRSVGLHLENSVGSGSELRELRDYQAGDSLRDIAWKSTLRVRRLIAREMDREVRSSTYVFLDISSSMRGGEWPGQKLDMAASLAVDIVDEVLARRDRVGLITFDEKLYGHIEPGSAPRHYRRILHHLVGLSSVVDTDLTEMDDADVERLAADYLLVQERLDFRKGRHIDAVSGVNTKLMLRWLRGTIPKAESQLATGALNEGIVTPCADPIRRFLQLRGVTIPYRVEARLGLKERGIAESIEHMVEVAREPQHVVIVTDLCGMVSLDGMLRAMRLAMTKRHRFRIVLLFTPDFYTSDDLDSLDLAVRELFTLADRSERVQIVAKFRAFGVPVDRVGPRPSQGEALAPTGDV